MAKTTLYRGGEGSNLYRPCSVQLRRRYWKTGGSVSRVLSKVVALTLSRNRPGEVSVYFGLFVFVLLQWVDL